MTDGIFLGNIATWMKIPRKTYINIKLLPYITVNIHTGTTRVYICKYLKKEKRNEIPHRGMV